MPRIAVTGDIHLTEGQRFDDTSRCLEFIVAEGRRQNVDLWLIGGDLTGTTVPHRASPRERNVLAAVFQQMAVTAPVLVTYGNHDYTDDLEVYGRLRGGHPIVVSDRPEWFDLGGVRVYCLPYPHKRWMMAGEAASGIESQKGQAEGGLRAILDAWRLDGMSHELPRVLLGHINIGGSRGAGGEVMIGREVELSPHDLEELEVEVALLSHIHLHQQVAENAWYAGSPDRSNFGEHDEKGFLVVDVERGAAPVVQRILTPARRYVTVEMSWDGTWAGELPDDVQGAEVRVRIDVAEEHAATLNADELLDELRNERGAHNVKVERRIIPKVRMRSEAIGHAVTTAEKLVAYWDSLGTSGPDEAARGRALEKLAVLERGNEVEHDLTEAAA